VPFSSALESHRLFERVLRVRRNPVAAYGFAIAAVAVATLARWALGSEVGEDVPFLTYFPAIVLTALVGGLGPGMLAIALAAAISWYLFLPPLFNWRLGEAGGLTLLLFVAVTGLTVTLVALLNAAVERVMAQEQNERVLIESSPSGIVVVDDEGTIRLINASTEKLFGYERAELLGRKVEVLVPQLKADAHRALREAFLRRPEARAMGAGRDLSGRRRDGSEFPVEIALNPVIRNGRTGVLATVIDISERRRAQERQQLMIRELHHRTHNLFAVIQSIASRTFVDGIDLAGAKQVFNGRLQALARAHTMLAEAAWSGAPLAELLRQEFAGFAEHLSISGCDIVVNAAAAQQFALIIHELATNAMKYGALSVPGGRVTVQGRIERRNGEATFSFRWQERGGPAVLAPTRKGFGSVILVDAARQFGHTVRLDYRPQGVNYELQLLLSAIAAPGSQPGEARLAAAPSRPA